jgi:hypothetical protein
MNGVFNTIKQPFKTDKGIDKGYEMRWKEHKNSKMIENEIKHGLVTIEETKRRFDKAYKEQMEWQAKRDGRGAMSSPTSFY